MQNRISSSSGAQNDFISARKARSAQKPNSLHSEMSCIKWILLIFIILNIPKNSFASHTVILTFCRPSWKAVPLEVDRRNALFCCFRCVSCTVSGHILLHLSDTLSLDNDLTLSSSIISSSSILSSSSRTSFTVCWVFIVVLP